MLESSYKHFSSKTLITGLMPLELSLGVGAAAREPSPKNNAWSSHLDNCAASRMVNGRTRTVTEIEDAPSLAMIVLNWGIRKSRNTRRKLCRTKLQRAGSEGVLLRLVVLDDAAPADNSMFAAHEPQQQTGIFEPPSQPRP